MTKTVTKPEISIHTEEPATAQRLREAFAAFDRGDLDHLRDNTAADAVWTNAGSSPISGAHRGWDQIVGMLGNLFELTDGTFKTQVVSILGNDDHAVAIYDATSTVKGATATHRFVLVDEYDAKGKVKATQVLAYDQAAADAMLGG